MPSYPLLSGGIPRITNLSQSIVQPVRVKKFAGGATQRWRIAAGRMEFTITHSRISWADVVTLRNFWMKQGSADSDARNWYNNTWSITVRGTTYNNCVFVDKTFPAVEPKDRFVDVTLHVRQIAPESTIAHPTIAGGTATFPAGIIQNPYTVTARLNAVDTNRETGPRYGYVYDPVPLYAVDLTLGAITSTQMTTLQNFWALVGGIWAPFTWTDPNTAQVFTNMYFAMDALEFTPLVGTTSSTELFSTNIKMSENR